MRRVLVVALSVVLGCAERSRPQTPRASPVTGIHIVSLACPDDPVLHTQLFDEGRFVAIITEVDRQKPQRLSLLSTRDGRVRGDWSIGFDRNGPASFDLLPSGVFVYVGSDRALHGVRENGEEVFSVTREALRSIYPPNVRALPTGNWLASFERTEIALIDGAGNVLMPNDHNVRDWAVSGDGERLAVRRFDSARREIVLTIHDGRTGKLLGSRDVGSAFDDMVYAPDHRALLADTVGGCGLSLLHGTTAESLATFGERPPCQAVNRFGFTKDGDVMIESGDSLKIWSLEQERPVFAVANAVVGQPDPAPKKCFYDGDDVSCLPLSERNVGYAWGRGSAARELVRYDVIPGVARSYVHDRPGEMVDAGNAAVLAFQGKRLVVVRRDGTSTEVQTWDTGSRTLIRAVGIPSLEFAAMLTASPKSSHVFLRAKWRVSMHTAATHADGMVFDAATGAVVVGNLDGDAVVGFRDDGALLVLDCSSERSGRE